MPALPGLAKQPVQPAVSTLASHSLLIATIVPNRAQD